MALALHDLGIPSTVYERRSEDAAQGGGIMLSPNALRVLDNVGVYKRIRDKGWQFDKLTFTDVSNRVTDVYYFGSEKLYGYQAIRIMRKELLDEMKTILRERNIPVHYNKQFEGLLEHLDKVEVTFTDDRHGLIAPLVIAADGIDSSVRRVICGEDTKAIYQNFLGINSVVQRSQLRIPERFSLPATVMAKPGAFLLVPQKADGSELFIGSQRLYPEPALKKLMEWRYDTKLDAEGKERTDVKKTPEERETEKQEYRQKLYDMLQESKSDWPDVVQSALEAMTVDQMGAWDFHGLPPLKSWLSEKSKRVILQAFARGPVG
ncbi:hypothetical protein F4780DRAFT_784946 [Xylariomycetidae sp. FL0641]|nr:hypothetical protein F4780DRAFT_784946 [Xylariomycetidae sp. FL0641]